jgi:hypothetical protein
MGIERHTAPPKVDLVYLRGRMFVQVCQFPKVEESGESIPIRKRVLQWGGEGNKYEEERSELYSSFTSFLYRLYNPFISN